MPPIKDNAETSPDLIRARYRAGRRQTDVNVEIGIAGADQTPPGASSPASSASPSATATEIDGSTFGGAIGRHKQDPNDFDL